LSLLQAEHRRCSRLPGVAGCRRLLRLPLLALLRSLLLMLLP
jgi:hypothetical protein